MFVFLALIVIIISIGVIAISDMKSLVDKVSELKDKTLDPRSFSFRLKHSLRKRINVLIDKDSKRLTEDQKKARHQIQSILDREEDSKEPLSYEDVTKLHHCWQRLDSSGDYFHFFEFLDLFRPIIPEKRTVSSMKIET
jgi:hypothetical protein